MLGTAPLGSIPLGSLPDIASGGTGITAIGGRTIALTRTATAAVLPGGFLVIAGITVLVAEGQGVDRIERIVNASGRNYAGSLHTQVRVEKRQWQVTTAYLTNAETLALKAAVALGAQVTCSGTLIGTGGATATCAVEVGDGGYLNLVTDDGTGQLRQLVLVLREV